MKLEVHKNLQTPFMHKNGNLLTQALFLEYSYIDPKYSIYTIHDEDKIHKGKTYYSLKKLYLQEEDITEYLFASKHLSGWQHWLRLQEKTTRLQPHIKEWREELQVLLRAKGMQKVLNSASTGNYHAAKFLVDKGWEGQRGRPSKDEVTRERKQQAAVDAAVLKDAERLGIKRVK